MKFKIRKIVIQFTGLVSLKGGVYGSAHVHESKYFSPLLAMTQACLISFVVYEPFGREIFHDCVILHANNCKHINHGINPTGQH